MEILLALLLTGGLFLVFLLGPIVSWLRASRTASEVEQLRARLAALEEEVRRLAATHPPVQGVTSTAATGAELAAPAEAVPPPPPERPRAEEPLIVGEVPPVAAAADLAAQAAPAPTGEQVPAVQPFAPGAGVTADDATAAPAPSGRIEEDWVEAAIGGRLLLYAGSLAVVLGVGFFLRYAFDHDWVTEWMRIALGVVLGLGLAAAGLRLARAGYRVYGHILAGAGAAVLYLSVYAAFNFYDLIGQTAAFVLLVAITVASAWIADREQSQGMAVMAVLGGFITPFLVGSNTDAQVTLFTYVALLIAGTMYLSLRRGWPLLNVVSYLLTLETVGAWFLTYYRPAKYLRTTLFITLFCAMFLVIQRQTKRGTSIGSRLAWWVLASAPVLYHFAAVILLFGHGVALPVYLIACSLAGVAWAMRGSNAGLRVALWIAVSLPLYGWLAEHHSRIWLTPGLITIIGIFLLHLVGQLDRLARHDTTLPALDLLLLHLNGLGTFLGLYLLLERTSLASVPYAGLTLAVAHAVLARQLRHRDLNAALHALAVTFSLVAATVAVQLDGGWLTAAWAAEGAAIMWIGVWVRRTWYRGAGAALLGVALWRWLTLSVAGTPAVFHLLTNEPFLVGLWLTVLLYASAWIHARAPLTLPVRRESIAALLLCASGLTVMLLTLEADAYWQQQGALRPDATFARGMSLSVLWALYAGILIAIGIRRRYAPIRYFAIALFGLTIGKVFLVDLSGLEGIYRVLGLIIVGAILLAVSFLYQRGARSARTGGESFTSTGVPGSQESTPTSEPQ
jgi:uncharacterized membrane protein